MEQTRTVFYFDRRRVLAEGGTPLEIPEGWELLPPGDAGLTRRVKAAGPSWTVIEIVKRKKFSRGVWAPAENIRSARTALEEERSTEAYAKKRASAVKRREKEQTEYVGEFRASVISFLRFSDRFRELEGRLADAVSEHATPVGSGTVARTERIPVERRAEAAVIAWMRHQTTRYDSMSIERVKGARREVRRELAELSRGLLDAHRRDVPHAAGGCPLCRALSSSARTQSASSP